MAIESEREHRLMKDVEGWVFDEDIYSVKKRWLKPTEISLA